MNDINLYFKVILKNKNTTLSIEYYYNLNELCINALDNYRRLLYLDDGLKSLRFADEEIQKINKLITYGQTGSHRNDNNPSDLEYKYESLQFISELLYNHRHEIVKIPNMTIDITSHDKTNINLSLNTDYSRIIKDNIAVTVNESIQDQSLNIKYFDNVDLQKMDTPLSDNLFKTVFKGILSKQLMTYVSRKTATDYKNSNKINYMYIGMLNDKTLKELKSIKNKIKNNRLLTSDEQKLLRVKGRVHTINPATLDTEIYDVIKIYPICDKKPMPKYITVSTTIRVLNKIACNIVDNKL